MHDFQPAFRKSIPILFTFISLLSSCGAKAVENGGGTLWRDSVVIQEENITAVKKYDAPSDTYYYLTRVKHKDAQGKVLALEHAHAAKSTGETVFEFARRMDFPTLAINASTMSKKPTGEIKPRGMQIVDGKVMAGSSTDRYTLGIKQNNELVVYEPGVEGRMMIKDGVRHALSAFIPLIKDHRSVPGELYGSRSTFTDKHPRQVIAQYDDLDLLILSCGGRGFDGTGMTAADLIRVLQQEGVKMAYMLDGGGSTTTVIHGKQITKKIDGKGTRDRLRPNFLYIR